MGLTKRTRSSFWPAQLSREYHNTGDHQSNFLCLTALIKLRSCFLKIQRGPLPHQEPETQHEPKII
jgi:hypothetical protein